jgi:hypothetical protein
MIISDAAIRPPFYAITATPRIMPLSPLLFFDISLPPC